MQNNNLKLDDTIKNIYTFNNKTSLYIPLIGENIPAGFPSPAQDYIESELDLNEYLITHPAATYFVRVAGYSMQDAGIFDNDILIVDRAIEPSNNKIIIAILDAELTIKRLRIENGRWFLVPENIEFPKIEITEDSDFIIWGVVIFSIHETK